MGRTSENKKEKILSLLHRLGHPRNRNGTRRTVKHVPFLEIFALPFLLFCFLFLFLVSFFFLIQQIPEGEKKEVFTSSPQRNTNYADEKFTTFHRPSPFSHRPPPDLNQTNHCPTSNKRVLHYFHGPVPYFPQDVEGPLSSPFLPSPFFSLFLSFLSPSRFLSRRKATHVRDFQWFRIFRTLFPRVENSNRTSLHRESIPRLEGGELKIISNLRRNKLPFR